MGHPIEDVSDANFEQAVVERSRQLPVVVDFWAPWCAPCRFLGPALEKEVQALGDRVQMVKVDVDQSPQVSAAYGIRSIPAVKAFRDGVIVAEFEGARDSRFLQQWLASVAPSPARLALQQAMQLLAKVDHPAAEGELAALLGDEEVGSAAAMLLARLRLDQGKPEGVTELLAHVAPRSPEAEQVPVMQRRLQFFTDAQAMGGEANAAQALADNPEDLEARYALASALAARGQWETALEHFLELVTRSRKFRDDAPRLAMLALFESLGPSHELTREFRRRLQAVL